MSKHDSRKNKTGLTKEQEEEIVKATKRQPPAGITFINERKIPESEIKESLLVLSRILSPDKRKVVEKVLEDNS